MVAVVLAAGCGSEERHEAGLTGPGFADTDEADQDADSPPDTADGSPAAGDAGPDVPTTHIEDCWLEEVHPYSPWRGWPDTDLELIWHTVPEAEWYQLWLTDPVGNLVYHEWYRTDEDCAGSWCFGYPTEKLPQGNYHWWIQAWGPPCGESWSWGPWGDGEDFTIAPGWWLFRFGYTDPDDPCECGDLPGIDDLYEAPCHTLGETAETCDDWGTCVRLQFECTQDNYIEL